MKTIYKYTLDPYQPNIEMPKDAQILCVQTQKGTPCIWAMIETDIKETELRKFVIYGTGHTINEDIRSIGYIGTFQLDNGALVFHVFEVGN